MIFLLGSMQTVCWPETNWQFNYFLGGGKSSMASLDHAVDHPKEVEDPVISARNARYGMILFLFYLAIYSGFVGLNAVSPSFMDWTPAWGLNLAVIYGFSLIVIAMILALIYCFLCRGKPKPLEN
jgi:uncharacterized membrane protein (DUF485 family)